MIPGVPPAAIGLEFLAAGGWIEGAIQSELVREEIRGLLFEQVTCHISLLCFIAGLVVMGPTVKDKGKGGGLILKTAKIIATLI